DGRRFRAARLQNLAQNRPAVDVQVVEGIPGPRHLEVLVEYDDHHADVVGGGAFDVEGALRRTNHGGVPVWQSPGVVCVAVDDVVPHARQLRVDRVDTRLAQRITGQVDLAQDIPTARREHGAIGAGHQHRATGHKALHGEVEVQARIGDVVVPHHAPLKVSR